MDDEDHGEGGGSRQWLERGESGLEYWAVI